MDGYKHVVDVEYCPPISSDGPHFPPEAAKAKEAAQNKPSTQSAMEYHEIMEGTSMHQNVVMWGLFNDISFVTVSHINYVFGLFTEEMIHGLQQLGWKKVDVSFHSAFWPFFAHNNIHVRISFNISFLGVFISCFNSTQIAVWIQVKNEWLHNAGVGVIAHVADSLKHQESSSYIAASL